MTVLELKEKRSNLWEQAKNFLDSKRNDSGLVSDEDTAVYDKMEADIDRYDKEISRLEKQAERDNSYSATAEKPLFNSTKTLAKFGKPSDDYSKAFWNAMRGQSVSNALSEGSDAEGGYLVPDEFERRIVESLEEENVMRKLASVIQTSSGERKIPIVATKGTASWVDEGGAIPESDDTFGQVTLSAYKLGTLIKVSDELLNDAVFNLESYIAKEFARRIGRKEEEAFFVGDGSSKPTGVFTANGGQVGVTAESATAITFDNIIDLYHSLKQPYRAKAVFVTNDATLKMLRKLKDDNKQYLWQPSVKDGTPDTLLGKPIYTSSYIPEATANALTVGFGDFSYYWIGDRQGRIFKRLNELYAVSGQVGFLATQRVDGKLILPEAVKLLKQGAGS
jgi:HK97 family phage major capsid protein